MIREEKYFLEFGRIHGKYATVIFQQWDGLANEIEFIEWMENQKYVLVVVDTIYDSRGEGCCIAENTQAEMLFRKAEER